jgi:hypothetical protein
VTGDTTTGPGRWPILAGNTDTGVPEEQTWPDWRRPPT